MHRRPVGLARRVHRLFDLRRIAQHEFRRDGGDAIRAPERGSQIDPFVLAEPVTEFPHDGDVRSAEPEYRLPVVPDREQLRPRRAVEQRLQQTRPGRGDVLELVDQDVSEGAPVPAGLHVIRGPADHVVEVDLSRPGQRLLVALEDRPEHRQERLRPAAVIKGTGPPDSLVQGEPAALEVLQEGRQEADERVDPPLVIEQREHAVPGNRCQLHAPRRQLLIEVADQSPVGALMREGLDQDRAPFGVHLALPRHLLVVLLPGHERRRVSLCVDPEMLDVDAVVREKEIGLVLAPLGRRRFVLVRRFILVGDAVEMEEIGDFAFLVALHLVALQRADLVLADVVPVRAPGLEIVRAPVGRELVLEPFHHAFRKRAVGLEIREDALELVEQRPIALRRPGQRGTSAFDFTDYCHAQAVECPDRCSLRGRPEAIADALLHLVPGVPREGEKQEFGRLPESTANKPSCLRHDDRGLAAACGGDHEVASFVDDHRLALLVRERPGLDPVEQVAGPDKLVRDERLVGSGAGVVRRFQERQDLAQHPEFRGVGQGLGPAPDEPGRRVPRVAFERSDVVGMDVSRRVGKTVQPVARVANRIDPRCQPLAPPVGHRLLDRVGEHDRLGSGKARRGRGARCMLQPCAAPASARLQPDRLDVAQGDLP